MSLRTYQVDLYNKIKYAFKNGYKSPLVCLFCRGGKSYIINEICNNLKSGYVLLLAHRNILLEQHSELIKNNVRINNVFTEVNHLGEYDRPSIIIIDEAHLSECESYKKVCEYYNTLKIGFTATPSRLDRSPLTLFDTLIQGISPNELIKNGNVSDYDYYAPQTYTFNNSNYLDSEPLMDRKVYGDIIKYYKQLCDGKQAIAYCTNIKHSIIICELFNSNGIKAVHMDGNMSDKYRSDIMERFKKGEWLILCNCNLISEGITLPNVECCLLLRPTQSLPLYIQQCARCLTPMPNKKAIIIDYVGNVFAHNMPTYNHIWELGKSARLYNASREPDILVRQCANCYKVYKGVDPVCPYCNFNNGKTRKQIQTDEKIELEKIEKIEKKNKRIEVGICKTRAELEEIARVRGYDRKWVFIQCKIKGIRY